MSFWMIVQIVFNVAMLLTIFVLWAKLKRPPQEDPRMSRGLQLLQSKIAVMENLSDKTEAQFNNINNLIEKKTEKLQKIIHKSEEQLSRLDSAMAKSMDVAEIFQDKIPHNEVIERKNSVQLITAARMAHAGCSIEEIVDKVKLPKPQVELICKVNKNDLIFDQENLPDWVKKMDSSSNLDFIDNEAKDDELILSDVEENEHWVSSSHHNLFSSTKKEVSKNELERIKKMGDEFKSLCTSYDERQRQLDYEIENNLTQKMLDNAEIAKKRVVENVGQLSQVVTERADVIGQKVANNTGAVTQKVISKASFVGQKIVDKASTVLDTGKENLIDKTEKSKVRTVKFPIIDSDRNDVF